MLVFVDERRLAQTRQTTSEYGLLGPLNLDYRLERFPASAALGGLIERFWTVSWDLERSSSVTLLPHPCVNLVYDRGMVVIAGVGQERFTYDLHGTGRVFGVKFRPGAFYPFFRRPVSELTGQTVPLSTLWGEVDAGLFGHDLSRAGSPDDLVAVAEAHLQAHWPDPDPEVARVGEIVHALLHDRTVTRVEEVGRRFALTPRSLQRLFHRYVGVAPKWVLQRYRLHEAAARLATEHDRPWAEIAVDLGYFDQPHFIRDFTRAIGMTPAAYAVLCTERRAYVSA